MKREYTEAMSIWMSNTEEIPFNIINIDNTGQLEVDINTDLEQYLISICNNHNNLSIEDFFKELIELYMLEL